MWWIRKRAKTIIPVLLLVAVACGGVLIFLGNSPSDGTEQGGSATANSSGTNSGEGAPDGGGVRVDSSVISDKGLKLDAGTYVVQVGKRKFVRVHLSA